MSFVPVAPEPSFEAAVRIAADREGIPLATQVAPVSAVVAWSFAGLFVELQANNPAKRA